MHINKLKIHSDINPNLAHLTNISVSFGNETDMQHLILTGKNGSGKTLLLIQINDYLQKLYQMDNPQKEISSLNRKSDVCLRFNTINQIPNNFISFMRSATDTRFVTNDNLKITAEDIHPFMYNDNIGMFINDFLIKLKFEQMNISESRMARSTPPTKAQIAMGKRAMDISRWFVSLQNALALLFSVDEVHLEFTYNNVLIKQSNSQHSKLVDLSDGYKSIFNIIGEILIRGYDSIFTLPNKYEGIVIIDEIENHLHIDFQRKILNILTMLFPKIQFIISTHSPFIINSLECATIFDLESQKKLEDMTPVNFNEVVSGYFNIEDYSLKIKEKITRVNSLIESAINDELRGDEENELNDLITYFSGLDEKYISISILNSFNKSLIKYIKFTTQTEVNNEEN